MFALKNREKKMNTELLTLSVMCLQLLRGERMRFDSEFTDFHLLKSGIYQSFNFCSCLKYFICNKLIVY